MKINIRFKDSTSVEHIGFLSYVFYYDKRTLHISTPNSEEQWYYNLDEIKVIYIHTKDYDLNI